MEASNDSLIPLPQQCRGVPKTHLKAVENLQPAVLPHTCPQLPPMNVTLPAFALLCLTQGPLSGHG